MGRFALLPGQSVEDKVDDLVQEIKGELVELETVADRTENFNRRMDHNPQIKCCASCDFRFGFPVFSL